MPEKQKRAVLGIATVLQCCYHDFRALIDTLSTHGGDNPDNSDLQKCKDQYGRLKIWDDTVHATSGELDHVLRRSPTVKVLVIGLLNQLIDAFEKGM
jgi:hypothetical protein